MAFVPDYASFQLNHPRRTHEIAAGRVTMVAASAHRRVQTQRNRVRKGQLDLAVIAARAEDPQIRNDPLSGADDGHRFLSREEAILIEPLERLHLMALAIQAFQ